MTVEAKDRVRDRRSRPHGGGNRDIDLRAAGFRARLDKWTQRPMLSFHLVVAITGLLTLLGLTMVLSASSVESLVDNGSAYGLFSQQLIGVALGLAGFVVIIRMRPETMRRIAFPAYIASTVMLMLVLIPGVGTRIQGSQRWFTIAGLSFQPSELAKLSLVLWGAHLLTLRTSTGQLSIKHILMPLLPGAMLMCLLVAMQPNLSTAITLGIILFALLWYVGFDWRILVTFIVSGAALSLLLTFTVGYRASRMQALFSPGHDPQGIGYQARQARYALADGGVFGQGLGQGTSKWNYLPNAYNDFIFAIIGEELGLIGCVLVIGLFAALALLGMRIAIRSADPFFRLLTASATAWICGQAVINIGYVVGLLPVTGLQLPLISYGGTSTALTLLVFGMLAAAARHEPEAIAAAATKPSFGRLRWLRLPTPKPYSPPRSAIRRRHGRARRELRPPPGDGWSDVHYRPRNPARHA